LIGQDLTAYGQDNGEMNLAALLKEIDKLNAVPWVRLLYAYPVGATEELLSTMVSLPSVCNYFDVPLQHSSESVLKRMNRPVGKYAPRKLVEWIQSKYPEISLRTTFIVGFPGETEEDFNDLEAFVSEGHFSNVGVFTFSPEEEVPASKLSDQIDEKVKQERRERLMLAQQKVLEKRGETLIGKQCKVLVDGFHEETDLLLVGRTENQAPEVDGTIIINDSEIDEISTGDFVTVEITERAGYDFLAKAVSRAN
jgi:ribosomal protein S12 methylthiotransferase